MKPTSLIAFLAGAFILAPTPAAAQQAVVSSLMTRALGDIPGKEMVVLEVTYPVGSHDAVHRHNAHGFIYVLEGSIVMQVRGGKEVTVGPGQMFYEGPQDIHIVGRNASSTTPARFLVFLLKNQGTPVLVPSE